MEKQKIESLNPEYDEHRANCPTCQSSNHCPIAHNLLLKEADYKPIEKKEKRKKQ